MGNAHQMVIDHVGEVVGRITVGLDQDHVVEFLIFDRDISVELIRKGGRSLLRIVLTDNKRFALCEVFFDLFFRQMQAVLVVNVDLLAFNGLCQSGQTLRRTEAVICLALVDQLFGVFHVNTCCDTFALHIGADTAVLVGTLVGDQSGLFECAVDDLHCAFDLAYLVCIFDTKDKIAAFMFGDQIGIKCCAQVSDVHASGGTGGVSGSDFHILAPINSIKRLLNSCIHCTPVEPKPPRSSLSR